MITKEQALTLRHGTILYHKTARNADGTALRCRVNGKCQTWKTRPNEWRLPVKYGLKTCFDIGPINCNQWYTYDINELTPAVLARRIGLKPNTPIPVLHDALIDAGLEMDAELLMIGQLL